MAILLSKLIAPSFFPIYNYMVYSCFRHDYYSEVPYNSFKRGSVHYLIRFYMIYMSRALMRRNFILLYVLYLYR